MKRASTIGSLAVFCCLGLPAPLLAAETQADTGTKTTSSGAPTAKAAALCLADLKAFNAQMEKDVYWVGASDYGYGYPLGGYGYGYPSGGYGVGAGAPMADGGYRNGRPGLDVRVLVSAANILARYGQQQSCEAVLSGTREAYKTYIADFRRRGAPMADVPGWRKQEIAAAVSVTGMNASFRSDELLGADVRSPQGDALGSVDDLVMSPKTGKIAYLVIARGGIFGFGEKYVPIPWDDFKTTPSLSLLVLNTTKADLDKAPLVAYEKFSAPGAFDQESEKVDAYWKTRLSN